MLACLHPDRTSARPPLEADVRPACDDADLGIGEGERILAEALDALLACARRPVSSPPTVASSWCTLPGLHPSRSRACHAAGNLLI
ncbi:MAG TPA: hypothetical protein ENN42_09405 [Thioalkalivibrio sp.]|nr:hypothetical protein [Thioalkalivibrio sp.]